MFRVPVSGEKASEALAKLDGVEKVEVKEGIAAITLKKKSSLTLSAIEKVVRVDREKLTLDGKVALRISGMTCESCSAAIGEALKLKGVSDVVVPDPKRGVVQAIFTGASYTDIASAIKKTKFTFGDVLWASCCGSCKPGQDCQSCGKADGCGG